MTEGFLLKPFVVDVQGFGAWPYPAASRGKALAQSWRDFADLRDESTFKDFLRIAKVYRAPDPGGRFGEPIFVGGKPAFYVGERGQYVRFVRPGETETFLSHPADVRAASCDTHPKGGDAKQAPFMSGAAPSAASADAQMTPPSSPSPIKE